MRYYQEYIKVTYNKKWTIKEYIILTLTIIMIIFIS
jgi:hypothetical protein